MHQAEWRDRRVEEVTAPKVQKDCIDCGERFETNRIKATRCIACKADRLLTGKSKRTCQRCGEAFRAERAKLCKACRQYNDRQRAHRAAALRYKSQHQGHVSISPTASVGGIAERLFDIACLARGLVVLTPIAECNPGFDRVVLRDGQFVRVQIKGLRGSRFADGERWTLGGGWERLNLNAFDELAIVDVDTGFMWQVPKSLAAHKFHPSDYAEHETHTLFISNSP